MMEGINVSSPTWIVLHQVPVKSTSQRSWFFFSSRSPLLGNGRIYTARAEFVQLNQCTTALLEKSIHTHLCLLWPVSAVWPPVKEFKSLQRTAHFLPARRTLTKSILRIHFVYCWGSCNLGTRGSFAPTWKWPRGPVCCCNASAYWRFSVLPQNSTRVCARSTICFVIPSVPKNLRVFLISISCKLKRLNCTGSAERK